MIDFFIFFSNYFLSQVCENLVRVCGLVISYTLKVVKMYNSFNAIVHVRFQITIMTLGTPSLGGATGVSKPPPICHDVLYLGIVNL